MATNDNLIVALQKAAGTFGVSQLFLVMCTVVSVNEDELTCVCTSISDGSEKEFPDVRLMPVIDDGVVYVPAENSQVAIIYSKDVEPIIIAYSELSKIDMVVGNSGIELTADLLQLNDGSYGGLIIIAELVKQINRLENKVNDLVSKYNSHTHVLTLSSGTGTAAPTVTTETPISPITQRGDLENKNITHGKSL